MASIINALSSGTGGIVTAGDASGILQLQTANTAAVTIDGSQNVGIGTASPGSGIRLDVLGGEIKAGRIDSSSEGGQVSFGRASDNTTAWYIDAYGNTSTPSLRFVDVGAGAVSMGINSSGAVALRGAVSASGVGITFPSTQVSSSDANTLDDYEEGTWTPTLTASSSNPTVSYQTQTGIYTRIGRTVTISGRLQISSKSGGSGDLRISGLPFANAVALNGAHVSWISGLTLGAGFTWADIYFSSNDTNLNVAASGSGQGATQLAIGAAANNFDMAIQFTYTT
jgi:hypothetical protein